jgi:nitrate reductase delta subunit
MIDLTQTYEKAGLFLAPGELPDYLPVVLEFVSTQPPKEARAFLGEMAHIFNAIFNGLQQRHSAYASVIGALLEISGESAHAVKVVADEPIDAVWEEPAVFDGCSTKGQAKPGQTQPLHFVKNDAARATAKAATHQGVSL